MRRKTRKKIPFPEPHIVPDVVRVFLNAWHERQGRPVSGPVFPLRRGARAGKLKESNIGYAKKLRRELLMAGVDRYELHNETPTTLPVDFHSTRRAFATAGVTAGLSEQQIMGLGGWSDSKLINRYKNKLTPKALPPGMIPSICPERAVSILPDPSKKRNPA
jgi:integrase